MADAKPQAKARAPLSRVEIERMADAAHELLDDPDAGLSRDARLRWEAAVVVLDVVLGRLSLVDGGGRLTL